MKRLYISSIAIGVIVLFTAMATTTIAGQGVNPQQETYITLVNGSAITWDFQADYQGFYALQLWLAETAPPGSILVVKVTSPTNPDLPATEARLALDSYSYSDKKIVLIHFKPIWILPSSRLSQTRFEIQLLVLGLPSDMTIMFQGSGGYTSEQEFVPAFVPLYQTRLLDRVWPISKMAAVRPGIFGWPPFYAILTYAFLISLFYVILRIWKPSQK